MKYVLKRTDVRETDRFCWIWNFQTEKFGGVYWFDTWGRNIPDKEVKLHINDEHNRWFGVLRDGLFYYVE